MTPYTTDSVVRRYLEALKIVERPRIFVSYQHSADQAYYDGFSKHFHDNYESVYDNSLSRMIDSDNPDYVIQRIRDEFITGTSCTVLLCGPTSYQRKYLDWEIKATLDKEHGLVGIQLPTLVPGANNCVIVPDRLHANIVSGYAVWGHWNQLVQNPGLLSTWIAMATARPASLIVNPGTIKQRNG
jgi:hypothetical protein